MTILVELHAIVADEGTIVLFRGLCNDLQRPVAVLVAVDHRMAQSIALELSAGFLPVVAAEGWQILGSWS